MSMSQTLLPYLAKIPHGGLPGGPVGKNPPASAEDMGSIQEDPPRLGASKPVCCNH